MAPLALAFVAVATATATITQAIVVGAVIGAVSGGIVAAVTGGDILKGIVMGGIVGGVTGGIAAWAGGAPSTIGGSMMPTATQTAAYGANLQAGLPSGIAAAAPNTAAGAYPAGGAGITSPGALTAGQQVAAQQTATLAGQGPVEGLRSVAAQRVIEASPQLATATERTLAGGQTQAGALQGDVKGISTLERLAPELISAGGQIVSGLAGSDQQDLIDAQLKADEDRRKRLNAGVGGGVVDYRLSRRTV